MFFKGPSIAAKINYAGEPKVLLYTATGCHTELLISIQQVGYGQRSGVKGQRSVTWRSSSSLSILWICWSSSCGDWALAGLKAPMPKGSTGAAGLLTVLFTNGVAPKASTAPAIGKKKHILLLTQMRYFQMW